MKITLNPVAYCQNRQIPMLRITYETKGTITQFTLCNSGPDIQVEEILLCNIQNPFPADAQVYGEGYSMLSQYRGTVAHMECIGCLDDTVHYRLPQKEDFQVVFNMALFETDEMFTLIGFSSCHRFCGEIRFNQKWLQISLNLEGKTIYAGQEVLLEDLFIQSYSNREALLESFATEIAKNHPRLQFFPVPDGWCSWQSFGAHVTERNILDNLDRIRELGLNLRFIQVDDGYQKYMGDWLTPADTFPSGIKPLFDRIFEKGFEPAIWVAPFIAEKASEVFRKHPDWFIQDEEGFPLSSAEFTFGGWRCGPWYMLDPTNPAVYEHLKATFRYIREEWHCRYFKLDANMWGAFPNGVRFNPDATAVESYRMGMKAILEGAGEDSFLLGCNAPMWPSIGAVHGNRLTGDVSRNFSVFSGIAREGFHRNWQNGRLWINDPDCVTIERAFTKLVDMTGETREQRSELTEEEFLFHATYIYATGGMVLSGDDLSQPELERLEVLRFLLTGPHIPAKFDDTTFRVGRIRLEKRLMLCLFNWGEEPDTLHVPIDGTCRITDIWHRQDRGIAQREVVCDMAPHSGMLLECCFE